MRDRNVTQMVLELPKGVKLSPNGVWCIKDQLEFDFNYGTTRTMQAVPIHKSMDDYLFFKIQITSGNTFKIKMAVSSEPRDLDWIEREGRFSIE